MSLGENKLPISQSFKIKLLSFTQRVLAILGLTSGPRIFPFECVHTVVSLLILILLTALTVSSAIFMVNRLLIGEYIKSFQAGFQVTVTFPLIGSFITVIYRRRYVRKVFDGFQKICDECKMAKYFLPENDFIFMSYRCRSSRWIGARHFCSR